jgi:nitrate reductase beta subunit
MNPDRELLAVLQLYRRSNLIIYRYQLEEGKKIYEGKLRGQDVSIYNDTVIAYDKFDKEIFRTTIDEPVFERPALHANSI